MVSARKPGNATAKDLEHRADDRLEIIDGVIVEKQGSGEHSAAQSALVTQVFGAYHRRPGSAGPGGWWILTEVPTEYEPNQVFRHDVAGWRRERVPTRPSGFPIRIRPDWVCELLSPSNRTNDTIKKFRVLHTHGVPYYWLLDVEERALTVHRHQADGYLTILAVQGTEPFRAEPFVELELTIPALLGETPDQPGTPGTPAYQPFPSLRHPWDVRGKGVSAPRKGPVCPCPRAVGHAERPGRARQGGFRIP